MTVSHVTENAPKFNALQWTGSNFDEVKLFIHYSQRFNEDAVYLEDSTSGTIIAFNPGAVPLIFGIGTWIVSAPYWGPQNGDYARDPFILLDDASYQARFTAIP